MRYSVCWNTGKPMCKISCLMLLLAAVLAAATDPASLPLWPGTPPGENGGLGPEKDTTKPTDSLIAGKPVVRLGPVSSPSMTLYRAPQDKNTGATVVVFPGGGYTILAMDLEGTEVCQWLNSLGVNCALVKYRVPVRAGLPRHGPPPQDAPRDMAPARPTPKSDQEPPLAPELKVTAHTPPSFLIQAEDDSVGVENSLVYYAALRAARVPAEAHLFAIGGHGYGLRSTPQPITGWPHLAEAWLRALGVLSK